MKAPISALLIIALYFLTLTIGCKKNSNPEIPAPELKVDSVYSWLCNMQQTNGLLLSSEGGRLVSLYDNALAAMAFTTYGDLGRAEKIFDFFNSRLESELLKSPGGFGQMRTADGIPVDNSPHRWLGDNAWLLIALNNYHHAAQNTKYQSLETALINWISSLQDADGGVWGGYAANGTRISKIAEGNIDAFNAVPGYTSFHQKLLTYFKYVRWDQTDKLIIAWAENPKYKYALDVLSWSYCSFEDFPIELLSKTSRFKTTQTSTITKKPISGYCFDEDRDVVWLEGTGQMAVAFIKAKKESDAQMYLQEMKKNLIKSSSFPDSYALPYSANFGTSYGSDALWIGVDTNPAVSSTVWYLFGRLRFDPLKLGYSKNIPAADKFWTK
jgi:cellulose synthase operon protein B